MDLPPDKAKLLKNYDYEKKWDIICDQVRSLLNLSHFERYTSRISLNFSLHQTTFAYL